MVDYIEKIQYAGQEPQYIESECFGGRWVWKYQTIASTDVGMTPNCWLKYSLNDYLPKDEYDYEVMVDLYTHTSNAAGQTQYTWVRSGEDNWMSCRLTAQIARVATRMTAAGCAIIPIRHSSRVIGLHNENGATTGSNYYFRIYGYRRLGNNSWNDNSKISGIHFDNVNINFGGTILPGKWTTKSYTLLDTYNIASKSTLDVSLSNMLPNDNFDYDCIIDGTATCDTANWLQLDVKVGNSWMYLAAMVPENSKTKCNYFNFQLPINANDRKITLRSNGASVCTTNLRFRGYRRIGIYK